MEAFRLIGAAFALDGQLVFDTSDSKLLDRERFAVFTTAVEPREHEIGMTLVHAGTGYGVFAYQETLPFRGQEHARAHGKSRGQRDDLGPLPASSSDPIDLAVLPSGALAVADYNENVIVLAK